MKSTFERMRSILLFAAPVTCLLVVVGCASTSPLPASKTQSPAIDGPVAEAPRMIIGDHWQYSDGVIETVRDVRERSFLVEYYGASRYQACVNALHRKDLHGTVVDVLDHSGQVVSDCNHYTGWRKLDFPIFIGKKWAFEADDISQSLGRMCSYKNEMEVVAYERVTVPAGTFEAFKILHKQQNLCRDTGVWNTRFYWYAPDAKAIVKTMSWNNNRMNNHLVEYTAE
jgi:hypothetical protein